VDCRYRVLVLVLFLSSCGDALVAPDAGLSQDASSAVPCVNDSQSLSLRQFNGELPVDFEGYAALLDLGLGRIGLAFEDGPSAELSARLLTLPLGSRLYVRLEARDCGCISDLPDFRISIWSVDDDGAVGPLALVTWGGSEYGRGVHTPLAYQAVRSAMPTREACGASYAEFDLQVERNNEVIAVVPPRCSLTADEFRITNFDSFAFDGFPALCHDHRQSQHHGMILSTLSGF